MPLNPLMVKSKWNAWNWLIDCKSRTPTDTINQIINLNS